MLSNTIVGTVVTASGPQPFVLTTATGKVRVGGFATPDPMQANMSGSERGAANNQVRAEVAGVKDVRVGSYCCPQCGRWVDVVSKPSAWSGDRCSRC